MRFAILAHSLRSGGGISVGQNIIAALKRIAPQHTYLCTIPAGLGYEDVCRQIPDCYSITYNHKGGLLKRCLYDVFRLPKIVEEFRPDVILGLAGWGLLKPSSKQTILPMNSHLFYPQEHSRNSSLKSMFLRRCRIWYLNRSLAQSQLLLSQTPITRRRLIESFQYRGQTAICPPAVSIFLGDRKKDQKIPKSLIPYTHRMKLFCLTKYYPHKNLEIIVESFNKFRKELKDVVVIITIAENQHPNVKKLFHLIKKLELSNQIINVGPLSQLELASYYKNCDALLLPTLLESFSSTYLEAMHFGLPILTSDLDFAHYVCKDAALYFNPLDEESIKNSIINIKNNPELANNLAATGLKNLKSHFKSWDEIVGDLITKLEQLV